MPDLVAVGDLMLDVVAHGSGHDARIAVRPGGSAANAAVWARALGASVVVVGAAGDDHPGRWIREALEERGVDCRVAVSTAPTGVFLLADGRVAAEPGASACLAAADLPAIEAGALLVSGYLRPAVVEAALERVAAAVTAVSVGSLARVPDAASVVLANEREARRLTGLDPEAAALALAAGGRIACVTRGGGGAVAALEGEVAAEAAGPPAPGPALGAGDAFAAAFVLALRGGASLGEALRAGCDLGAAAAAAGGWPAP